MERAVFVGLGGSGTRVVGHLKAKLLEHAGRDLLALAKECRFLFLDTDQRDIAALNTLYGHMVGGGREFIDVTERVDLGVVNPRFEYSQCAKGQSDEGADHVRRFLSWFDPQGLPLIVDRQLREGASANRQQGRIAVWRLWRRIRESLSRQMTALSPVGDPGAHPPLFYVVSGTCGGTGSSAFLDVAFLIDRLGRDYRNAEQGGPVIRAMLMMPHFYIEALRRKQQSEDLVDVYQANAFAFFSELDAVLEDRFRTGDGTRFSRVAARIEPGSDGTAFVPFSLAFCVDHRTERGQLMRDETQFYSSTAELLYYWQVGSGRGPFISAQDNAYMRDLTAGSGDVPAFNSIGYAALRFPAEQFFEYLRTRFVFEALHFGVLGEEYEQALPDSTRRKKRADDVFRTRVCRYLFQDEGDPTLPNLERDRREAAQTMLAGFGLDLFMDARRNRVDPDLVGDDARLEQFEQTAARLAAEIEREIARLNRDGAASREELLKSILEGVAGPQVREHGLDDLIEDDILRRGARYTARLLMELDVRCDERMSALVRGEAPDRRQQRLSAITADVSDARTRCLRERSGRREQALNDLHALLLERLHLTVDALIARQQADMLGALCLGESGLLDRRRHFLLRLIGELGSGVSGSRYEYDLPKRFAEIANDVTTVYAPDITRFLEEGHWVQNHAFAVQYRKLVPQRTLPGGIEEPLRGSDDPDAAGRDGLHALLWQMLAGDGDAGTGYASGGALHFFRHGFTEPATLTEAQIIQKLQERASQTIESLAKLHKDVHAFMTGSLLQHFDQLPEADRARLRARFDDEGCQVFCQTEGHRGAVHAIYAGGEKPLAEKLGYQEGKDFVPERQSSRMLRIKVVTKMKLSHYAGFAQLGAAYERLRGTPNVTHIHAAFQRHGARHGLKAPGGDVTAVEQREVFAQMLYYRSLMREARVTLPQGLAAVLDADEAFIGESRRLLSPLTIEGSDNDAIFVCHMLRADEHGRVQILERHCHRLRSHLSPPELLKRLEAFGGDAFATAIEFGEAVQRRLHSDWVNVIDRARDEICGKLRAAASRGAADDGFYGELHDKVAVFAKNLRKIAESRPPSSPVPGAAPAVAAGGVDIY